MRAKKAASWCKKKKDSSEYPYDRLLRRKLRRYLSSK